MYRPRSQEASISPGGGPAAVGSLLIEQIRQPIASIDILEQHCNRHAAQAASGTITLDPNLKRAAKVLAASQSITLTELVSGLKVERLQSTPPTSNGPLPSP